MAKITVLKLDPESRDLCFDADGIMDHLEDGEAIAQNIRNNLNTWKGEFELDTGHGTAWERVVGKAASGVEDEADDVIRASIFQEPYVREIESLTPLVEGRKIGAEFSGTLYDGSTVRVEAKSE